VEPETQRECAAQATLLLARHLCCCCCSGPKHMRGEEEEGENMSGGLRWRPKRVYNAPLRDCERGREREREREERGRGESARARRGGGGNYYPEGINQVPSNAWAWMLVPGGYLTSTSLGLYLGLALGYPLGWFFSFFFFPFLGSYWQPFRYVLALLAILKTKRSAKIMCSFWGFFKSQNATKIQEWSPILYKWFK